MTRDPDLLAVLSHPEPRRRASGTSGRSRSAATRSRSSSASSPRSGSASGAGSPAAAGRARSGPRGLGGAVRPGRRPALPRGHRPRALLRRGRRPDRGALHLARRPGGLGRDRVRRRRGDHRRPAARDQDAADGRRAGARPCWSRRRSGRWGNWFNQELFGKPTDLPWALEIDPEHRPPGYEGEATFHPTFLYECVWNLAAFGVLIGLDRRFQFGHGRMLALYVMAYTLGRGWIEMLRIDTVELNDVGGLRFNVWTSIVLFVVARGLLRRSAVAPARPRGAGVRRGARPPSRSPRPPAEDARRRQLPRPDAAVADRPAHDPETRSGPPPG